MNLKVAFRGCWLRVWQRLPSFKYSILEDYYPHEFKSTKGNPDMPAHMGVTGHCIGPNGFILHKCQGGFYQASQKYYTKLGDIKTKEIMSGA